MANSLRLSTEDPLAAVRLARLAASLSMHLDRLEKKAASSEARRNQGGSPPENG